MDESSLLDLLECSVCLERLDTTAKVLPCQHTFCRRCLESIVCSRHELRCPECRILVGCGVDELPANILLVRLLDGIRQRPRAGASPGGSPSARPGPSSGAASALAGGGGSAAGSAPGSPVFLPAATGSATASLRELATSRSAPVAKVVSRTAGFLMACLVACFGERRKLDMRGISNEMTQRQSRMESVSPHQSHLECADE
uniref:RING-type domain-containing protein n=1 Tax=Mustela putorius furo TaxID=9669 RepID=M3YH45_MUSPF